MLSFKEFKAETDQASDELDLAGQLRAAFPDAIWCDAASYADVGRPCVLTISIEVGFVDLLNQPVCFCHRFDLSRLARPAGTIKDLLRIGFATALDELTALVELNRHKLRKEAPCPPSSPSSSSPPSWAS